MSKFVDKLNLLGVEAKQIPCIKGEGAPTSATEGAVGCFYMDILTGNTYKCVGGDAGDLIWVKEQIQADWAQTDTTKADYIKNKPSFKFDTLLSASIEGSVFNLNQENDACVASIENNVLMLV